MIALRAMAVGVARPAAPRMQRPARPLHRQAMPLYVPQAAARHATAQPQALEQPRKSWLPAATFALKLISSALAGATITLAFWPADRKPVAPPAIDAGRPTGAPETQVYRRNASSPQDSFRSSAALDAQAERPLPLNYPRRVPTVRFSVPMGHVAYAPDATVPPLGDLGVGKRPGFGVLAGKQLRYLIGGSAGQGHDDEVTMVSYSTHSPVKHGVSIAYCNLFDEHNSGKYGPYLHNSDTAKQYNEGQVDPKGEGWEKNLRDQFERRSKAGFEYIELDNPDAYKIKDVIGAIELAATYNLKVIAKNPGITDDPVRYVSHPNVYGIIVEKGAGGASDMERLRKRAGKPDLPVWFVAFGSGRSWAKGVAGNAKSYRNMGVTYSSAGEYGNALDVLNPADRS
jgi:hypothetical protein